MTEKDKKWIEKCKEKQRMESEMKSDRERLIGLVKESLVKHIDKSCALAENIVEDLLANGVMLIDTDKVNLFINRKRIQTAFGMPLDELAELIRAKQENRIIVPPVKVGDVIERDGILFLIKAIHYRSYRGLIEPFHGAFLANPLGNPFNEVYFFDDDFGANTRILTQEEVERELEKRNNDD